MSDCKFEQMTPEQIKQQMLNQAYMLHAEKFAHLSRGKLIDDPAVHAILSMAWDIAKFLVYKCNSEMHGKPYPLEDQTTTKEGNT